MRIVSSRDSAYSHSSDITLYPSASGNDLIMPGTKAVHKKLLADIKAGRVDMNALELSAERVLRVVFNSDSCKGF